MQTAWLLFDLLVDFGHLFGDGLAGFHQGAFTHRMAIQVGKNLNHPLKGHKMVLAEINHLRIEPGTILNWLAYSGWKFSLIGLSTLRASLDLGLMLGHFNLNRWQIKNLAAFIALGVHSFQRCLAVLAASHAMHLDVIRLSTHF